MTTTTTECVGGPAQPPAPERPSVPAAVWWAVMAVVVGGTAYAATGDWVWSLVAAASTFLGVPVGQYVARGAGGGR